MPVWANVKTTAMPRGRLQAGSVRVSQEPMRLPRDRCRAEVDVTSARQGAPRARLRFGVPRGCAQARGSSELQGNPEGRRGLSTRVGRSDAYLGRLPPLPLLAAVIALSRFGGVRRGGRACLHPLPHLPLSATDSLTGGRRSGHFDTAAGFADRDDGGGCLLWLDDACLLAQALLRFPP
jgi:hypothetical protein